MMLFWKNKATRAWNFGERVERMGKARCQLHLFQVSEVGPLTFTTFPLGCCSKFCLQLCFPPPPCFLHQGQRRIVLPTSLGILIFAVWMFSSNLFRNNHQKSMVQRLPNVLGKQYHHWFRDATPLSLALHAPSDLIPSCLLVHPSSVLPLPSIM